MKKPYIKPEITKEELRRMLLETNEKLEKANADLAKANEQLRKEEQERTALFANLSHDLRSSLSVIRGAVTLLQSEDAEYNKDASCGNENETASLLELIAKRTGFMQRLIEDMFFLAKLESRAEMLQMREMELRLFLEDFFFSVQADPQFEGHPLQLSIPEDFSQSVRIDPEMTVRILDNLFQNARKYAGESAAIILGVKDTDEETVTVFVRDTGAGIDAEDLPRIFERTYRSSEARTPEEGSAGLGLPIAKSIAERMGGSLSCESEAGNGTTFYVTLKRAGQGSET